MFKKIFTDSLVQVAIILSLMRPDLNDYLYDYELEEPEVQDYIMGESLAYLQTSFHQTRGHHINSPKSIVERDMYIRDLLRDLSRPSRFIPQVQRNVDAWLVNEVPLRAGGPGPQTAQAPSPHSGQHHQEAGPSGGAGTTPPTSVELSKEEMKLIEVLWQEDVDAGRGLETGTRAHSSRDKPQAGSEAPSDLNNNDENQENNQNVANNADSNNNNSNNFDDNDWRSSLSRSSTGSSKTTESSEDDLVVNDETGEIERPRANLQNELPEMVDDMSTGAISLEEAVRALELHVASDWTSAVMYPPQPAAPDYSYAGAVTTPLMASQLASQGALPALPAHGEEYHTYGAQTAHQYNSQSTMAVNNNSHYQASTMFSAPLQAWSNSTDYMYDTQTANFTLLPPSLTSTNTSMAPTYSQNATMNTATNMSALIAEFDAASLFPNITSVNGPTGGMYNLTNAGNQSMIDLLDSEDLDMMDLEHLNFTSDVSSVRVSTSSPVSVSDSAVSMGSGGSPLTVEASPAYDGTAGASGGQDDSQHHHKYKYASGLKAEYHYYDTDETRLDHMRYDPYYYNTTNQTAPTTTTTIYDPSYTIAHNHTYMSPEPAPVKASIKAVKEMKSNPPRDAQKARSMNLPLSYDEIIDIPVEELTGVLQKYKLTDDQIQLIRDIRRRGKNKLAAQNCRKRRIQEIDDLEHEVENHRKDKMRLAEERSRLEKELIMVRSGYDRLYDNVLRSLTDESGRPYDPSSISLEMNAEGRFVLVPRNTSNSDDSRDFDSKLKRKK